MTLSPAEQIVRDFEETPISEWTFDAIRGVVREFGRRPIPERIEALEAMGAFGVRTGKGANDRLRLRLERRLGSYQRCQTIGAK
jgi:hypothetical protein